MKAKIAPIFLLLLFLFCDCWTPLAVSATIGSDSTDPATKGPKAKRDADALFEEGDYHEAAILYWKAVLFHTQTPVELQYDVQEVFQKFLQCYTLMDKPVEGLAFVSLESFRRGQTDMGESFLQQALAIDPKNPAALAVQREFSSDRKPKNINHKKKATNVPADKNDNDSLSPEDLYAVASSHFSDKEYESCSDIFEKSCQDSGEKLGPSCANAVYCRSMICDWGFNGTQFEADMKRISDLTRHEVFLYRRSAAASDEEQSFLNNDFAWQRATSVHPHMMLGYPLPDLTLKRFVAESVAFMDEMMARFNHALPGSKELPPLPADLPYPVEPLLWQEEKKMAGDDYKIRVGFVGSGFNSKAVLYLSKDMFRFFDKKQFEVHAFSFNAPDSALFIKHGMRGVDWRKQVRSNVDRFHDLRHWVENHMEAARYVRSQKIHILIEWDGYARQGERAQGLFGLRPAPIQMLHQEYLGTSGALYVDYIFTDQVTSPLKETRQYFTEKMIYLPNHFFSKGHALQNEVHEPSYEYVPRKTNQSGYVLGTGTPQQNKCLGNTSKSVHEPSFVFCNWNKFLKNNPDTMRSWIQILRQVPNSILCLLENPPSGQAYIRKFVHETAGTLRLNGTGNPYQDFEPGDGDSLNDRIFFLPWERDPFHHQRRNFDFCNVMLDSFPYNGHTVAQDALYAGVPIVTRSDGLDMSSRVTTSANIVLELEHLNAKSVADYVQIATRLATNETLFKETRAKLIATALQRNPMHRYWDVPRYVKNFEQGLKIAWNLFLGDQPPDHIYVVETEAARAGTFDEEILAHPPMGPNPVYDEQERNI